MSVWTAGDIAAPVAEIAVAVAKNGAPDAMGLYFSANQTFGVGTNQEIALNYLFSGTEPGFYPTFSNDVTVGWDFGIDMGISMTWINITDNKIRPQYLLGSRSGFDFSGSGSPALIGINFGIDKYGIHTNTTINFGLGFTLKQIIPGSSGKAYTGFTMPLGWERENK